MRPRKQNPRKAITIRLEPETIRELDAYATEHGITRTAIIEAALNQIEHTGLYLDDQPTRKTETPSTSIRHTETLPRKTETPNSFTCHHPKGARNQHPWGTTCNICHKRL